jgi:hypothetical protein
MRSLQAQHSAWAIVGIALLICEFTVTLPVHAIPLLPGNSVSTPGTTLTAHPELNADVIAAIAAPFTGTNALGQVLYTGTLNSVVVLETSGTLDFAYAITNNSSSIDGIARVSVNNFAGFTTDVDWLSDTDGTLGATSATRQVNGGTVSFNFGNFVMPGQTTHAFYIKTNATDFHRGSVALSDGGVATVQAFAPTGTPGAPIVPEPTTLFLLGSGLFGLAGWRRWRNA